MERRKAMELLENFPDLTPELEKQMKNGLEQYLLYDKRQGECYCTRCESKMRIPDDIKHRRLMICQNCAETVTAINVKNRFTGCTKESEARFAVLLSVPEDDNLYIRCFELTEFFEYGKLVPMINIIEHQRYVFTAKSAVRYGRSYDYIFQPVDDKHGYYIKQYSDGWTMRSRYAEPVFDGVSKNYAPINTECIKNTCMRYSGFELVKFENPMWPLDYLRYYQKHPGVERLVKCGLMDIVRSEFYGYSSHDIDYSQTEPHKMIGVSKDVFQAIRAGRTTLTRYKELIENFPGVGIEKLLGYDRLLHGKFYALAMIKRDFHIGYDEAIKYVGKQLKGIYRDILDIQFYCDYLENCKKLGCDMNDPIIRFPPHLVPAHNRAVEAVNAIREENERKRLEEQNKKLEKISEWRKKLEFSSGDLFIRQPASVQEIVAEGNALSHCVGGYANRHANGDTTIMFLRKKSEPDRPFFTIEVSNDYKIAQCHGYKNEDGGKNRKPEEILAVEKEYQQYLDQLRISEMKRKKKLKKGA